MAQRYGGKHSPVKSSTGADKTRSRASEQGNFRGAKRTRAGGRVNFLFLAPLPLIFPAFFGGGATSLAFNLVALGLLLLAAWLTREGLLAQEAYEARKVARRPGFPRKIAGTVLTGLGLGLASYAAGEGIIGPIIYMVIGATLHTMAFGIDPLTNKGMEGVDLFQTDRVARAVENAEQHLIAMSEAIKRTHDRALIARVEGFQTTARDLFRTVEEDPRDLTAARKYLSVYLKGARDATVKFSEISVKSIDTHSYKPDAQSRADYVELLDDLEENFAARTQKMLLDDRSDLNIEIEVLRERLQREG